MVIILTLPVLINVNNSLQYIQYQVRIQKKTSEELNGLKDSNSHINKQYNKGIFLFFLKVDCLKN